MTRPKGSFTAYRTTGAVILERLADAQPPAALRSPTRTFADAQRAYQAASDRVEDARAVRDGALAAIGEADEALDQSVLALADRLVGAGLGKRTSPFVGLSRHTPADLCDLAYATEIAEVQKLVAAIGRKKPTAEVKAAAATCTKNAAAVTAALGAITVPQTAYRHAIDARDATLLAWQKALTRLKKHAAACWDEDPAQVKAIFAPPDRMQAPVRKRVRKPA